MPRFGDGFDGGGWGGDGSGFHRQQRARDAELESELRRRERAIEAANHPDCAIFQFGERAEDKHCRHAGKPVRRVDGHLQCRCTDF